MDSIYNYLNNIKKEDEKKYDYLINWDKYKVVNLLIEFLNENFHCKYLYSIIDDINGNSADTIVIENSKLFSNELEGNDLLHYDVEQLIDNRYTDNNGEIIILDLNGTVKSINLAYLIETTKSKHISYSKEVQKYLEMFLSFLIKKKLQDYEH